MEVFICCLLSCLAMLLPYARSWIKCTSWWTARHAQLGCWFRLCQCLCASECFFSFWSYLLTSQQIQASIEKPQKKMGWRQGDRKEMYVWSANDMGFLFTLYFGWTHFQFAYGCFWFGEGAAAAAAVMMRHGWRYTVIVWPQLYLDLRWNCQRNCSFVLAPDNRAAIINSNRNRETVEQTRYRNSFFWFLLFKNIWQNLI